MLQVQFEVIRKNNIGFRMVLQIYLTRVSVEKSQERVYKGTKRYI